MRAALVEASITVQAGNSMVPVVCDCWVVLVTVKHAPEGIMGRFQVPFGPPMTVKVSVVVHVDVTDWVTNVAFSI